MNERFLWMICTVFLLVALGVTGVMLHQESERSERVAVMTAIQNANLLAASKEGDLDEVRRTLELALRADLGSMQSYVKMRGSADSDHYKMLLSKLSENHPELYAHLTRQADAESAVN